MPYHSKIFWNGPSIVRYNSRQSLDWGGPALESTPRPGHLSLRITVLRTAFQTLFKALSEAASRGKRQSSACDSTQKQGTFQNQPVSPQALSPQAPSSPGDWETEAGHN